MNVLLGQSIENRSIYTADMKATDFRWITFRP